MISGDNIILGRSQRCAIYLESMAIDYQRNYMWITCYFFKLYTNVKLRLYIQVTPTWLYFVSFKSILKKFGNCCHKWVKFARNLHYTRVFCGLRENFTFLIFLYVVNFEFSDPSFFISRLATEAGLGIGRQQRRSAGAEWRGVAVGRWPPSTRLRGATAASGATWGPVTSTNIRPLALLTTKGTLPRRSSSSSPLRSTRLRHRPRRRRPPPPRHRTLTRPAAPPVTATTIILIR